AIARAVIGRPRLLLADEPTGNVDDRIGLRLMHLFEELNKLGTTVVIATHNDSLVARFRHPQLRISRNRLLLLAPPFTGGGVPPPTATPPPVPSPAGGGAPSSQAPDPPSPIGAGLSF